MPQITTINRLSKFAIRNEQLDSIDALRACAALLVLYYHLISEWRQRFPESELNAHWLIELCWNLDLGKIGVLVFFLISGYLIPFSSTRIGSVASIEFMKRRLKRIMPMFYVSLMLSVPVLYTLGKSASLEDILLNAVLMPNFFGSSFLLGIYWTLQIEIIFYLIIASVMLRTSFSHYPNLPAIMMLACLILAEALRVESSAGSLVAGNLSRIFGMTAFILVGSLLRLVVEGHRTKLTSSILIAFLFHEFLIRGYKLLQNFQTGDAPRYAIAAGAIALIVFIVLIKFKRITAVMLWIGKISYSLYLLHGMILWGVLKVVGQSSLDLSDGRNFLIIAILYSVLSISVSALTYYCVERKFIYRQT